MERQILTVHLIMTMIIIIIIIMRMIGRKNILVFTRKKITQLYLYMDCVDISHALF